MARAKTVECQYAPKMCALLGKEVWAIMTRPPGGTWRIVNCLEKEEACGVLPCAFTTADGGWPYTNPIPTEQRATT
ncbi:MAG: hypothetical protein HY737_09200 [Candidatus Omnitrophica bacterium]|nr:hypothetical protein [Candidatus Omnitrophota bacterium]